MKENKAKLSSTKSLAVQGIYYKKGKKKFRSQMEIKLNGFTGTEPDLMVVMMNPGGSKPIKNIPHKMVAAIPDATQFRIMEFMNRANYNYARILNLSDICEVSSSTFYNSISLKKNLNTHSIFNSSRSLELEKAFKKNVPTMIAWGVNDKLSPLIEDAFAFISKQSSFYFGYNKPNTINNFYHPMKRKKDNISWVDGCLVQHEILKEK